MIKNKVIMIIVALILALIYLPRGYQMTLLIEKSNENKTLNIKTLGNALLTAIQTPIKLLEIFRRIR